MHSGIIPIIKSHFIIKFFGENFTKMQTLYSLVEKEKSIKISILKNEENETVDPDVSTWKSG